MEMQDDVNGGSFGYNDLDLLLVPRKVEDIGDTLTEVVSYLRELLDVL